VFPKHFFDLVPIEGSALSPRTTGFCTVTTYHLDQGKLNLPNIIRSKVCLTRIDKNAT